MKKLVYLSVIIVLFVGLLSACSQSTTTTSTPTSSPPPTSTMSTSSSTPTSSTSTPPSSTTSSTAPPTSTNPAAHYGGTLIWAQTSFPIDLGYVPTQDGTSSYWSTPALEPIVDVDQQGRFLPTGLTTALTIAPDGMSVTLTLRKGVKFHDGTDFNAAAAKWNLEGAIQGKMLGTSTWSSVDALDDYTVRINLTQPDYSVVANLGGVTGFMVSPTAFEKNGKEWTYQNPVGTGPFKISSFKQGVSVSYVKNPDYWRPDLPYLDGIDIILIQDSMVASAALQNGDVDVINIVDFNLAEQLVARKFVLSSPDPGNVYILTPDSKNPDSPLSKLEVREALEYGVDKVAIAQIGAGFWKALTQSADSTWVAAYDPSIPGRTYDPDKAKQMLADAGYPDGFDLMIEYQIGAIDPNALVGVQGDWAKIGVKVSLNAVPRATFVQDRSQGWHDGFILIRSNVEQVFSNTFDRLLGTNGKNYTSTLRTDTYKQLLDQAMAAQDYDTYQKRLQAVEKDVYDEALWMPMWAYPQLNAMNPNVQDANFYSKENLILWTPEQCWLSK